MMLNVDTMLVQAGAKLEGVRDALAAVYAYSLTGQSKPLLDSAAMLEASVKQAEPYFERVTRLMRHLRAPKMTEAAAKLCAAGRCDAAYSMLKLLDLSEDLMSSQVDVSAFLGECLDSLEATMTSGAHQARGGRLLGSA